MSSGLLRRAASGLAATGAHVPHLALLLGIFVLSRGLAFAVGVRFDTFPLNAFHQIVDPPLLREHLLQSLYYLHMQPPLFNLGVGLVLKAFPNHYYAPFILSYAFMGAAILVALYILLVRMGLSSRASAVVALFFSLSPAAILYENFLFYDYPLLFLLTLSALALHLFIAKPTWLRGTMFFGAAAAVIYTRSLYHLLWLVAVIAVLAALCRPIRRRLVVASVIPLLLVVGLFAKNYIVFGVPASSSWVGMNLAQTTHALLTHQEQVEFINAGEMSKLPLVGIFKPLDEYGSLIKRRPPTGVPVLDQEIKSLGNPNFNNPTYIDISNQFLRDDLSVIRHRPDVFLRGILRASRSFFWSPTRLGFFGDDGNRSKIKAWDRVFNAAVYWVTPFQYGVALLVVAAYVAALLVGVSSILRSKRARQCTPDEAVAAFGLVTIVYTALVANVTEIGENYRYRWVLDPIVIAMLASPLARHGAAQALQRLRRTATRAGVRGIRP